MARLSGLLVGPPGLVPRAKSPWLLPLTSVVFVVIGCWRRAFVRQHEGIQWM
jgi:hypothetical protein